MLPLALVPAALPKPTLQRASLVDPSSEYIHALSTSDCGPVAVPEPCAVQADAEVPQERHGRARRWRRLRGGASALAIESSLDGFEAVAEQAAAAAARNQLALSQVTQENLKALGLLGGARTSGGTASARDDRLGLE